MLDRKSTSSLGLVSTDKSLCVVCWNSSKF